MAGEWVVIVQRERRDVYEELRQLLQGTALRVVLDRRQGERRRAEGDPARPRLGPERRRGQPVGWVYPASALAVSEPVADTPTAMTDTCSLCGATLEWELPRFPQPPARLETKVRHLGQAVGDAAHAVEVEAFTATGRPILSHRAPTRRRA
jgi:hypothetical protein